MTLRPMSYDDVPGVGRLTATAFYRRTVDTRPANWRRPS